MAPHDTHALELRDLEKPVNETGVVRGRKARMVGLGSHVKREWETVERFAG